MLDDGASYDECGSGTGCPPRPGATERLSMAAASAPTDLPTSCPSADGRAEPAHGAEVGASGGGRVGFDHYQREAVTMKLPQQADSGRRGLRGVCVSVTPTRAVFRLAFDDCVRAADGTWKAVRFFTHLDLTRRELKHLDLTRDQLADIGLALVTRLRAVTSAARPAQSRRRAPPNLPSTGPGQRHRGSSR